jgi:hypothetical protein
VSQRTGVESMMMKHQAAQSKRCHWCILSPPTSLCALGSTEWWRPFASACPSSDRLPLPQRAAERCYRRRLPAEQERAVHAAPPSAAHAVAHCGRQPEPVFLEAKLQALFCHRRFQDTRHTSLSWQTRRAESSAQARSHSHSLVCGVCVCSSALSRFPFQKFGAYG